MNDQLSALTKKIGSVIIRYEKAVNKETVSGKQATLLIMAVNDIERIIAEEKAPLEEKIKDLQNEMKVMTDVKSGTELVYIIQGDNMIINGCFNEKQKAENYISGSSTMHIKETIVL